jgi:hypothetical protein
VTLPLTASAQAPVYNYFSPGCALSGTASQQTVNLNTGGCIVGNLSVTNLNGGTAASASTYFSGAGTWTTPPGAPGGANQQVQVNNSGVFAGYPNFTWTSSNNSLYVGYSTSSTNGSLVIGGTGTGVGTVRGGAELDLSGNPLILYTTGGGALNIAGSAGTGASTGTSISMTAGNTGSTSSSPGGAVTITGGVGNASAASGQISLVGGSGYSTTGTAGNVSLQGGLGNTLSKSGQVNILTNNTTRMTIPNTGGLSISSPASGAALTVNAASGTPAANIVGTAGSIFSSQALQVTSPNTVGQSNGMRIVAGTNYGDSQLMLTNAAGTINDWIFLGDGGLVSSGQSDKGAGTVNAQALYVNGLSVNPNASWAMSTGASGTSPSLNYCLHCGSTAIVRSSTGLYMITHNDGLNGSGSGGSLVCGLSQLGVGSSPALVAGSAFSSTTAYVSVYSVSSGILADIQGVTVACIHTN